MSGGKPDGHPGGVVTVFRLPDIASGAFLGTEVSVLGLGL